MAKNKVSDWDVVANNNTDLTGTITLGEGMPPSYVNDAIREMMAQIKQWQSGVSGDDWTSSGVLNVTGSLKLDDNLGSNGQVLTSKGTTETPIWKTLGTMSNQNYNSVNITGGTITGLSNLTSTNLTTTGLTSTNATFTNTNTTGTVSFDGKTGSSGQVLTSQGGATPIWKSVETPDVYTKAEIDASQNAQNTKINANTAKKTNATHTGDVTGSTTLTIGNGKVTEAKLATNSVTASKIAANAVGASEIAANAVGNSEIAANAVKASELYVSGNGNTSQYLRSDGDGTFTWDNPSPSTEYRGIGTYSTYNSKTYIAGGSTITIGSQKWRVMGTTGTSRPNIYETYTIYLILRLS